MFTEYAADLLAVLGLVRTALRIWHLLPTPQPVLKPLRTYPRARRLTAGWGWRGWISVAQNLRFFLFFLSNAAGVGGFGGLPQAFRMEEPKVLEEGRKEVGLSH